MASRHFLHIWVGLCLALLILGENSQNLASGRIFSFGLNTGAFGLGWEFSDDSIVLIEDGTLSPPPNVTVHAPLSPPNSVNLTGPLRAPSVLACKLDVASLEGSIVIFSYDTWQKCYTWGYSFVFLEKQAQEKGALAAIIEVRDSLEISLPFWSLSYADDLTIPTVFFSNTTSNSSSFLQNLLNTSKNVTVLPPYSSKAILFSQQLKSSVPICRGIVYGVWAVVVAVAIFTYGFRVIAERNLPGRVSSSARLLHLSIFFIFVSALIVFIMAFDPLSNGRVSKSFATAGSLGLLVSSVVSCVVCISMWWSQMVQKRFAVPNTSRGAARRNRFNIAAGAISIVSWLMGTLFFIFDAISDVPNLVFNLVQGSLAIGAIATYLICGFRFFLRLAESRKFEKTNNVYSSSSDQVTLNCCGIKKVNLTRMDLMLLRTGGCLLVLTIFAIGLGITAGFTVNRRISRMLTEFLYHMLVAVGSLTVLLLIFVAPAKRHKTASGSSNNASSS
eukprot:TRINITY_DN5472_c0_g1_i1.p1 TRINITY_DN5472_c0_g1~~TRINITY_DN5472_c0_g1_i1.p1  ORF type:complete len:502 (-),score=59.13 TRINITY_DN5472_c0_g1_i1:438-1943(-)